MGTLCVLENNFFIRMEKKNIERSKKSVIDFHHMRSKTENNIGTGKNEARVTMIMTCESNS